MGQLVDLEGAELIERRLGAVPIVGQFLSRLGLEALFDAYVPMDPRASMPPVRLAGCARGGPRGRAGAGVQDQGVDAGSPCLAVRAA